MPSIVVLKAESNKGKTSTLRNLAKCLIKESVKYDLIEGSLEEFDFIVCIKLKDICIGIVSRGDDKKLKSQLKILYENCKKIDIIFTASRTKGITVKIIKDFAKAKEMDIIWTTTYQNKAKYTILNEIRAQELCEFVNKI